MRDETEAPPSDRTEPANDSRLLGNEKLYRDLIENSLGLICAHDENGKLLTVNKAAADALGYEISDLVGHNLREFTPAKFHRRVDTYIAHVFRNGTARGYLYLRTRTGEQATWVYRNKVYREAGEPPIVLGHAQDITWRLEIEREIQETNENYRRLFEEAPVAYHEIDKDGILIKVNRAECELLGYDKQHVLGRPVWELVVPEQQEASRESVFAKLAGEQPLVPFVREYIRHDGKRLLLHIHENLIRSGIGEVVGIRSTMLDVTEQHKAVSELRRLNKELDKRVAERTAELNASNERMREFVYTVSHDLQEPLRSIISFADLLKKRYASKLDTEGVEFLDYVHAGAGRMRALIKDLLAYSRVLHDQHELFEPVSLKRVVEIVRETLKDSIESTGATITCGELPTLRANPNRMLQLFQNLISNAIKYRSDRPPVIKVDAYRDDDRWVISVTDNGIGIERADHERIFGLFNRAKAAGASGSGIGLAICHAIVTRHGGRISVESAPGGGSVFRFTLRGD
jgi:PAS domain S-box-containing protein